jgi:hypothetical protein
MGTTQAKPPANIVSPEGSTMNFCGAPSEAIARPPFHSLQLHCDVVLAAMIGYRARTRSTATNARRDFTLHGLRSILVVR